MDRNNDKEREALMLDEICFFRTELIKIVDGLENFEEDSEFIVVATHLLKEAISFLTNEIE